MHLLVYLERRCIYMFIWRVGAFIVYFTDLERRCIYLFIWSVGAFTCLFGE